MGEPLDHLVVAVLTVPGLDHTDLNVFSEMAATYPRGLASGR
jgi:hypothetical protein